MKRVIVYEMKDGKEEVFEMKTKEDEQHERAAADRELHSRDTSVAGYRFEWSEHWLVKDFTGTYPDVELWATSNTEALAKYVKQHNIDTTKFHLVEARLA